MSGKESGAGAPDTTSVRLPPLIFEAAALLLLLIAAVWMASDRLEGKLPENAFGLAPGWYVAPATMAAGHGLLENAMLPGSPLEAFLTQQRDTIQPEEIPAPKGKLHRNSVTNQYLFLMWSIGMTWSLFGLSWASLKVLAGALYLLAALAAYTLFRTVMGRVLSLLGALYFVSSPLTLEYLPVFRDFGKVPFLLLVLALLVLVLKRPHRARPYLALAAALALTIGIGVGFRFDLIICLGPALAALALARLDAPRPLALRIGAVVLLLVVFRVVAWYPVQSDEPRGSAFHVIGGYAENMETAMGLRHASYNRNMMNSDPWNNGFVNHYSENILGLPDPVPYISAAAVVPGRGFLLETLRTFPADMLRRGYGSLLSILRTTPADKEPGRGVAAEGLHTLLLPVSRHLQRFGVLYAALTMLALAWRDARLAWIALALLLFFGAYPNLQFHERHYFHLTLFPAWFLGLCLHQAISWFQGRLRHQETPEPPSGVSWLRRARNTALSCTALALLVVVPVASASLLQDRTLEAEVATLRAAEKLPLSVRQSDIVHAGEPMVLFELDAGALPAPGSQDHDYVNVHYLVAVFESDAALGFTTLYHAPYFVPGFELTRWLEPPPPGATGETWRVFPVFESSLQGSGAFKGITIRPEWTARFKGLYRFTELKQFPLLLEWTLYPGDAGLRTHQTLDLEGAGL
jgi:hypothetical protein